MKREKGRMDEEVRKEGRKKKEEIERKMKNVCLGEENR